MMMTSYNSTETFMKSDKPSEIAVAATNHIYTGKKEGRTGWANSQFYVVSL